MCQKKVITREKTEEWGVKIQGCQEKRRKEKEASRKNQANKMWRCRTVRRQSCWEKGTSKENRIKRKCRHRKRMSIKKRVQTKRWHQSCQEWRGKINFKKPMSSDESVVCIGFAFGTTCAKFFPLARGRCYQWWEHCRHGSMQIVDPHELPLLSVEKCFRLFMPLLPGKPQVVRRYCSRLKMGKQLCPWRDPNFLPWIWSIRRQQSSHSMQWINIQLSSTVHYFNAVVTPVTRFCLRPENRTRVHF